MTIFLVSLDAQRKYPLFQTNSRFTTVGRASDSDIVLNDPSISRRHCELVDLAPDEGTVNVAAIDTESTNGTRVNGQQVQHATLKEGDRLGFGSKEAFQFRITINSGEQKPSDGTEVISPSEL